MSVTSCHRIALAAALFLWLPAAQANDEFHLGRLFFTPAQRQTLETQRHNRIPAGAEELTEVTLEGSVSRSSGKRTLWINGIPHHDATLPPGMRAVPGGVRLQGHGAAPTRLKPGEAANPMTGEIRTPLPAGGLAVQRPQP
jgi:hypothetical protein